MTTETSSPPGLTSLLMPRRSPAPGVALPVFDLFANAGWLEPGTWLTPELVVQEFAKLQVSGMRLFDT